MAVELRVQQGDVTEVPADVLLLKYAMSFHGADEKVAARLISQGVCKESQIQPQPWEAALVETDGAIAASAALFIGTPGLFGFRYPQMHQFARQSLEWLRSQRVPVRHLTTTVHGAGYGLDVEEALLAMAAGFQDALAQGEVKGLETITFIERKPQRADRLQHALSLLPSRRLESPARPVVSNRADRPAQGESFRSPQEKKRVFVAMAFADEFEDVYQFGIYDVVRRHGFVCERVDETALAGSIVDVIQDGIRNAEFVIADLSGERPNVYLEVGYAWGLNRKVILVARENTRLHFDLSHHKCIFYKTIGKLAQELERTIVKLFPAAT